MTNRKEPVNLSTEVSRDFRSGKIRATTTVALGPMRELRIETSKSYGGGIDCSASVVTLTEGGGYSMRMGLASTEGADFSKRLASDCTARATEKNIRAMHASALAGIGALMVEVNAAEAANAAWFVASEARRAAFYAKEA